MFDFFSDQIDFSASYLSGAQVEMILLCAAVFGVFILLILSVYFLVEIFKWITGGWKK